MRSIVLLVLVVALGCAADPAHMFGDASGGTGAGGDPGTGGTGGDPGTGGAPVTGTGGTMDPGTGGGAGSHTIPTCSVCEELQGTRCVLKPDGTRCGGPGLCDGAKPFFGQNGRLATNEVCRLGVCVAETIDCRKPWCMGTGSACPANSGVCTNADETENSATVCACGAPSVPDASCR